MCGNCRKQRPSLWIGADGGHGIGQPAARFFDRTGYARWRRFLLLGIAGKTTYIMTEGRQSNARLLSVTERQPSAARLIAVATFAFMLAELPSAQLAPQSPQHIANCRNRSNDLLKMKLSSQRTDEDIYRSRTNHITEKHSVRYPMMQSLDFY